MLGRSYGLEEAYWLAHGMTIERYAETCGWLRNRAEFAVASELWGGTTPTPLDEFDAEFAADPLVIGQVVLQQPR